MQKHKEDDDMEAVLVIDMGNESLNSEPAFIDWFRNHNCVVEEEVVRVMQNSHEEVIAYSFFPKASTCIFKFETDGEYFPGVLTHFIQHLTDDNNTQISVAEEGNHGEYNNLVDMTLGDFITYVINGEDIEE